MADTSTRGSGSSGRPDGIVTNAVGVDSSFARLQKRSFGGEDVATRPGAEDDAWWPKGALLPGIQNLIDDFVASAAGAKGLRMVFLLGGAGNGKSYAARELGHRLGIIADADALAHRIYETNCGGTRIELLNDATIAPSGNYKQQQKVALAADIQRWWNLSSQCAVAAFCCVNRGIVIDELRALSEHGDSIGVFARAVIRWLASPTMGMASELSARTLDLEQILKDESYRQEDFELDGHTVHIAALSVDCYSLLQSGAHHTPSIAGALFHSIIDRCRDDALSRPEQCPIRANALQWLSPDMISKWESLLASAEIASGRLHSYRDIWGLASLSILGPRFAATDGASGLLDHVDRCLELVRSADSPTARLRPLLDLARFRLHNALFRSPVPGEHDALALYPPATPAHAGLSLVDPSVWGSKDSPDVESAMQVIALGDHPSSCLDQSILAVAWREFDQALEDAVIAVLSEDSCPDSIRRRLISWLGGYLMRAIAVARGNLGNSEVLRAWRHCRERSANGPSSLPIELDRAIRTLLFPFQDEAPSDRVLIPAFAVRVEPLVASHDGMGPTLAEAIAHNGITLRVKRSGGRLLLECVQAGTQRVIGQLALDFSLLREALASRGNVAGQTESTSYVEPRIERCRASSLEVVPVEERSLVLVSGGRLEELSQ